MASFARRSSVEAHALAGHGAGAWTLRSAFRIPLALTIAAHGLIHVNGFVVLSHLGEPGALRYGDLHPTPGTMGALIFGVGWLVVTVLFLCAAATIALRRGWWRHLLIIASALSIVVLAPSFAVTAAGIVMDAVILAFGLGGLVIRGRAKP